MFNTVLHKFIVSVSLINSKTNETIDLTKAVGSIAIRKRYYSFSYPLFVVQLRIDENTRKYIAMNDVDISLSINRFTVNENTTQSEDITTNDQVIDKNLLNVILTPYDKSKIFANPNTSDVQEEESSSEVITSQLISYEISCIPKDSLNYNSTIMNECFLNANVNEILLNIVSNIYTGDVYLQESYNTKRYDSIVIPPMSLIQAVDFLQEQYFLYETAANMFFDSDKLFIYDIKESSRTFNNEMSISVIKNSDTYSSVIFQNAEMDENNNVRFYLKNNPLYFSTHDVYKDRVGTNTVFNSYDDNFNLVSRNYVDNNVDKNKSRYFWNPKKYSYFENSEMNQFYQYISFSAENIDFTLFKPDTKILIGGSDLTELNGQYALMGIDIYLIALDYTTFSDSISLTLGKL